MEKFLLIGVGAYILYKYYYPQGIPANSTFNPHAPNVPTTPTTPVTSPNPNNNQTQPSGNQTPATTPSTQVNAPTTSQPVDTRTRLVVGMQQIIATLQGEGYSSFMFNVDQWNDLMRSYGGVGGNYPSPEDLLMNDRNGLLSSDQYLGMIVSWFEGGYGGGGMGDISVWTYGQGGVVPMERLRIVERRG